jgi:hypothetical protein
MQFDAENIQGEELPAELADLIEEMREAKQAKIEEIGKWVAKKRDEAVKHRKQSGIEAIWEEDEEYYEGIDDANRDSKPWTKSASITGGISRTPIKATTRCSSFFNVIRQFVDSASARMGDILLPAGDWNWSAKPTPVQDEDLQAGKITQDPVLGNTPRAGEIQQQQSKDLQAQAIAKADRAEQKMRDWLVECSYHTEVRKVIEDSARVGTGILKGPYPEKFKNQKITDVDGKKTLELVEVTGPASKRVDYWDFYPDPCCGEDIHNGSHVLEKDRVTARQLKDMKGLPGYLNDHIDKVLDEGPGKKNYEDGVRSTEANPTDDDRYEIWYFHGLVDVAALSAMTVKISEKDSAKEFLPAVVVMVNDTPIKAFINPLDTGEFPYDVMVWQRRSGEWSGVGVARQGRTPQDMLNAAARRMMDNAGLSAAPQLIIRSNAIRPADKEWNMYGGKVWLATEQADIRSVGDAIMAINIPMMQAELSAIIQMAYKMMEDATASSLSCRDSRVQLLTQSGEWNYSIAMLQQYSVELHVYLTRESQNRTSEGYTAGYWLMGLIIVRET